MFHQPLTIEEARAYRYGCWAGNTKGHGYKEGFCCAEVSDSSGWHYWQGSRKNKSGPGGLYCGIHAKRVRLPDIKEGVALQPATAAVCHAENAAE